MRSILTNIYKRFGTLWEGRHKSSIVQSERYFLPCQRYNHSDPFDYSKDARHPGGYMGKVYDVIDDRLANWLRQQHMFFVATAPLDETGSINCSPKGGDSFRILGDSEVAYQDLTGSGVETIAHLQENGRIVLMFCAFEGSPKIVRLHGNGTVLTKRDQKFEDLVEQFPYHIGTRSIIHIAVNRISDSCGYSVPLYQFQGNRDILDKWSENKGEKQLQKYRQSKNAVSIDGLPGLESDT
jgi:hypothetical protein